jgi:hypothetical protein
MLFENVFFLSILFFIALISKNWRLIMKRLSLFLILFLMLQSVSHASLNDGLVAYYPFNGNANDESGNGNNGAVTCPCQTLSQANS